MSGHSWRFAPRQSRYRERLARLRAGFLNTGQAFPPLGRRDWNIANTVLCSLPEVGTTPRLVLTGDPVPDLYGRPRVVLRRVEGFSVSPTMGNGSKAGEEKKGEKEHATGGGSRALACVALAILTSSNAILVSLSKGPDGRFPFDVTTIPFLAEAVKLLVCVVAVLVSKAGGFGALKSAVLGSAEARVLTFAVPAVLYLIKNSVDVMSLSYINPPTFQLLGNLKIVTTAFCLRLMLQKRLNDGKWAAVLLLCASCSLQVAGDVKSIQARELPGVAMIVGSCLLSSLAGVYNEKLLKQHNSTGVSIYVNNIFLYGWGVVINGTARAFLLGPATVAAAVRGYNAFAWLSVVNLGMMGLTVSYVILHLDNLAKLFAGAMAMLSSAAFSWWLLDTEVTFKLCLTILTVSIATYFYGGNTSNTHCDDAVTALLEVAGGMCCRRPPPPVVTARGPKDQPDRAAGVLVSV